MLLSGLLLAGCKSSKDTSRDDAPVTKTEVVFAPKTLENAAKGPPEAHGSKWQDDDEDKVMGGFQMFKEAWVYVDGRPVGVLREPELPPLPEVWIDEVETLDFKRGDPGPHERYYQVRRWRLADYFEAVGVDLKKVKVVLLHGGRGAAFIDGKDFRRYRDKFLFDLTGNTNLKLRVWLPEEILPRLNTSFDRYAAISVIVDKPKPTTNWENDVLIDGVVAEGIPYYGQPLRGGIRVYTDGALAFVIKRNALGDEGRIAPGTDEWSIAKLLAARGIDAERFGAMDVVDYAQITHRYDDAVIEQRTFKTDQEAQGAILLDDGKKVGALLLWSKDKVPPIRVPTPAMRDKK